MPTLQSEVIGSFLTGTPSLCLAHGLALHGGSSKFGPLLDPQYNTALNIQGTQSRTIILTTSPIPERELHWQVQAGWTTDKVPSFPLAGICPETLHVCAVSWRFPFSFLSSLYNPNILQKFGGGGLGFREGRVRECGGDSNKQAANKQAVNISCHSSGICDMCRGPALLGDLSHLQA